MPRPSATIARPTEAEPPRARRRGPRDREWSRSRAERLALLRALQRSLQPEVVVETFVRRLREGFAVDGVAFDHPEYGRRWGARGDHAFAARLKLDGTALGKLEFYRREAFGRRERCELNELAELLLHPLHNALMHACLQKQALEDGLTGLLNRQALERMLPRELAAAERQGRPLALVMIDVDLLKPINDTWGHAAGDRVLQAVAAAITGALRQSDLAFRLGGDEFMLLLPATDEAGARTVIERIRKVLAQGVGLAEENPQPGMDSKHITFSAGVAASLPGMSPADLTERADRAMYRAKHAGGNRDGTTRGVRSRPRAPDFATERVAARIAPR